MMKVVISRSALMYLVEIRVLCSDLLTTYVVLFLVRGEVFMVSVTHVQSRTMQFAG